MWIMIAGPYGSGARNADDRAANLQALNRAAVEVLRRGHVPIIGVNLALPIIEAAGSEYYARLMMPLSLSLADRCDAILRIEGTSEGADEEVQRFIVRGLPVYRSLLEIPENPSLNSRYI